MEGASMTPVFFSPPLAVGLDKSSFIMSAIAAVVTET
jgi:hypothetical protein